MKVNPCDTVKINCGDGMHLENINGKCRCVNNECRSYTIHDTTGNVSSYLYQDCDNGIVNGTFGGNAYYTFCAISGSVQFTSGTITNNGLCSDVLGKTYSHQNPPHQNPSNITK